MQPISSKCLPFPNDNVYQVLKGLGVQFKNTIGKMIEVELPKGWGIVQNVCLEEERKINDGFKMWNGYLINEKHRAVAFMYWFNSEIMSCSTIELVNEIKELDMNYMTYDERGFYDIKDYEGYKKLYERIKIYYNAYANQFSQTILDLMYNEIKKHYLISLFDFTKNSNRSKDPSLLIWKKLQ